MTSTQDQPARARKVAAIAALAVVVAAPLIGFAVWKRSSGPANNVVFDIGPVGRDGMRGMMRRNTLTEPDGVQKLADNSYRVRGGGAILTVDSRPGAALEMVYDAREDLLTPEQTELLSIRRRLTLDRQMARSLNITEQQMNQLRDLGPPRSMLMTDADRARLQKLWEDWVRAADKKPAEQALIEGMREIAQQSLERTRANNRERAEKVKSILSPEQLEKMRQPAR
jgi:Spy/CpxP family protein refolding chaperone